MESQSRVGAIFCLRRKSLKNELRTTPCCGFTSSSAKEPFCQTFSRTASAPPEELLLQRSQSHAKQALTVLVPIFFSPILRRTVSYYINR